MTQSAVQVMLTNKLTEMFSIYIAKNWVNGWIIDAGHRRQSVILAFYSMSVDRQLVLSMSVDILMFMFLVVAYLSVYLHGCFRF